MIIGIGTDLVEIARIEAVLTRTANRFARKILADAEWALFEQSSQPAAWLAKRWAAKEACAKALGTGVAQGISLTHMQVFNDELGAPYLQLVDRALEIAQSKGINQWHLSLADEQAYALAFVVMSRNPSVQVQS